MSDRNQLSRKLRRKQKRKRRYMPSAMQPNPGSLRKARLGPHRIIDTAAEWFAVRTSIKCERRATLGLREHGFDVWNPVDSWWREFRWKCTLRENSVFSRYIFVGMKGELRDRFGLIRDTDGVEAILGVVGCPIAIRPEALQEAADEIAGIQKLADAIAAPFDLGQRVFVTKGPFASFDAIVEELFPEKQTAMVAVEIFGRTTPVELEFLSLQAA